MESDAPFPEPKPSAVTARSAQGERAREVGVSARGSFEERRKELETFICDFQHDLWERGCPFPTDVGASPSDQEAALDALARKLESDLQALPARASARTLAGIVIEVAAARLRALASLAACLSVTERKSLGALLRLSEQERRALGTLLNFPDEERRELATVLSLSNLECQVLAAFIADQQAGLSQEASSPKPLKPLARG